MPRNTAVAVQRQEQKVAGIAGPPKEVVRDVKADLEALRPRLMETLPSRMDPDRFLGVVTQAILRSPKILECDKLSIFQAVLEAAQLGLEPTGLLGSAYLVPYKEHGVLMAHLIPGYRGLIDLAKRSGEIEAVWAQVVRAKDYFRIRQGTEPGIDHEPWIAPGGAVEEEADPGPIIGAYMVAVLRDRSGQPSVRQTEWMSAAQIEAVRKRSKAADDGPWVSDYSEMARKTVVRRGAKYLPLTPEAVRGFSLDEEAERSADDPRTGAERRESGRSRLVRTLAARRGIAETPVDVSGPPETAEVDQDAAPEGNEALSPSGEPVGDVCGSVAGDGLMEGAVCSLVGGHPGAHKTENGSWPA